MNYKIRLLSFTIFLGLTFFSNWIKADTIRMTVYPTADTKAMSDMLPKFLSGSAGEGWSELSEYVQKHNAKRLAELPNLVEFLTLFYKNPKSWGVLNIEFFPPSTGLTEGREVYHWMPKETINMNSIEALNHFKILSEQGEAAGKQVSVSGGFALNSPSDLIPDLLMKPIYIDIQVSKEQSSVARQNIIQMHNNPKYRYQLPPSPRMQKEGSFPDHCYNCVNAPLEIFKDTGVKLDFISSDGFPNEVIRRVSKIDPTKGVCHYILNAVQ